MIQVIGYERFEEPLKTVKKIAFPSNEWGWGDVGDDREHH